MDAGDVFARVLPLLLAHADETCSCAALAAPVVAMPAWQQQVRTRAKVPISVAAALRGVKVVSDAAGARARLACVCTAARNAADADVAVADRRARAARALACTFVAAMLVAHGIVTRGAAALKSLCVAAEPPLLLEDASSSHSYEWDEWQDDERDAWLKTWPGFLQRVAEVEAGVLAGVLYSELRHTGDPIQEGDMGFALRHALRGMLITGWFSHEHDHWGRAFRNGASDAARKLLEAIVGTDDDDDDEDDEDDDEAQEDIVLEEHDRMLKTFEE
jgi:hypothetical protein